MLLEIFRRNGSMNKRHDDTCDCYSCDHTWKGYTVDDVKMAAGTGFTLGFSLGCLATAVVVYIVYMFI